ncbi:hypothetical protein JIN77_12330 [Verrucomicrobiaceae bacterium R5-34]|uniref:Uncharacterized protein n=1 Tax=Oceaniferula flava TaxID=2800421 RepID=A0AAE2SB78_9BACT|nr:hypothetical protein [Oceaniferula flavus]MBK1831519.1 hypothetical protein [Verrucomicrobiaceae bacterium R5-34]MBK1854242.1 hypothetical protein [Oceaniferula flavus]MBM1135548.1 hypothetical protein [Oceaniferula flavus]
MRIQSIILLVLLVAAPMLSARTVRAIFLQPHRGAPKTAFLFTGTKSIEIDLPRRNLSPQVEIPEGKVTLAVSQSKLTEGVEVPRGIQSVKIPAQWSRCLLVFIPKPNRPGFPAVVMAINSSDSNIAKGDTMVYNLSDALFIGKFGNQTQLSVRPRKSGIVKAPIDKRGSYPVAIDCVLPETKKRSAICRTNWMHHPKARQILFVVPSSGQKVPRVWGVLDRRDERKEP